MEKNLIHRGGLETEIRNGGSRIVNVQHRKDYVKGGCQFVECALCGQRYNVGRGGNGAGLRWCRALKNDWWAKHTGQESPEVIEAAVDVKLCPEIGKESK